MDDNQINQLLENALSTNLEPNHELNEKIIQKVRENNMNKLRKRKFPVIAAACLLVLCCSVTAFAAWSLLTPKDVAIEYGDKQLAKAFESKDAIFINESKKYDKYQVTLLGAVSGKGLTDFCDDSDKPNPERTYAVVAIAKTDGSSMPNTADEEYGKDPFFISPLIEGLNPKDYNIASMNGSYFEIVREGIMYRMIECDDIEMFADRHIYLCALNSMFYNIQAFDYNEQTGDISVNDTFEGMNLLFDLPLNKDKADKEEADKYLKQLSSTYEEKDEELELINH